ncbi:MAG: beta-propeller fold lactonase family protein [Thermoguttaceae bacterium]|nr:beta-propeller fold lactonase family protein [Thermoguttaceae bacterium]
MKSIRFEKKWLLVWSFIMLVLNHVIPLSATEMRVFVGGYDQKKEECGIYVSTLDDHTLEISEPQRAADLSNPYFLIFSPDYSILYAVGGEQKDSLVAFRVNSSEQIQKADRKSNLSPLEEMNRLTALGKSVCHLTLDAEWKNILTAHYGTAEFALFSLKADHSLNSEAQRQKLEGKGPNEKRQEAPHPHSVKFGSKDCFYVPDLGTDKIMIYRLDPDKHSFVPNDPPYAEVSPGSGPRHICFIPEKKTAYVANELSSTVTAFHVLKNGGLEKFQTLSTLPENDTTVNYPAEVAATPDGRFLYVSNRGHDSLACFKVAIDGTLTLREIVPVHGKNPRHFAISPSGNFLITANQDSSSISLFEIHPDTGKLKFVTEKKFPISPACILWEKGSFAADADEELRKIQELKPENVTENWDEEEYPWNKTFKSLEKMNPQLFREELILARLKVKKMDQLANFIRLGFEMEALSKEDENRDFIREMTVCAVIQHSEIIASRLSTLELKEMRAVRGLVEAVQKNLEKSKEWNPNSASVNLCLGWMIHFSRTIQKKDAEDTDLLQISDPEAQKLLNTGISLALKQEKAFENYELLANSIMNRAIWTIAENPEEAEKDMELAASINPELKEQVRDTRLLLYLQTEKYENALELLDSRIGEFLETQTSSEKQEKGQVQVPSNENVESEKKDPKAQKQSTSKSWDLASVKKILTADNQLFKLLSLRLEILVKLEKFDDALESVELLLGTAKQKNSLLLQKFQILFNQNKFRESLEPLNEIIEENSIDPQLYSFRAQIYLLLQEPEKALKDIEQTILLEGETPELLSAKISILLEMEKYDEVQKEIEARLEKEPKNIGLLLQNANLQIVKENYSEAFKIGKQAEEIVNENQADSKDESLKEKQILEKKFVIQFLANFYLMSGEHVKAAEYYESFLSLDEANALALNNLAWLYSTSPDENVRNGQRALNLAEKAVELEPNSGYLSTLAAAHAELGNFEKALEVIEKALKTAESEENKEEHIESLQKEKTFYEQKKPFREKTETYRLK